MHLSNSFANFTTATYGHRIGAVSDMHMRDCRRFEHRVKAINLNYKL